MKNSVTDGFPLKPGPYNKNHGDKTNESLCKEIINNKLEQHYV